MAKIIQRVNGEIAATLKAECPEFMRHEFRRIKDEILEPYEILIETENAFYYKDFEGDIISYQLISYEVL